MPAVSVRLDRPVADSLRAELGRAYRRLRADPGNPDLRLAMAELVVQAGRRDLVYRHMRRALDAAPKHWGGLPRLADLLFRIGEHRAALQTFDRSIAYGCVDPESLKSFAGLLHAAGLPDRARNMLAASAMLAPLSAPRTLTNGKPTALRIRSFDNSRYTISRNARTGLWTRSLKSGHFSLGELLDDRFDLFVANCFGENLASVTELPPVGLILNSVACPDLNPDALNRIARFTARFPGTPVINPAERVLRTTRAENAIRLNEIEGIRFPATHILQNDAPPAEMRMRLESLDLGWPVILRRAGTQTGISMVRAQDADAAELFFETEPPGARLYAIAYIDQPDADGLYRKTRVFFIDGQLYPVANLVSDSWQIHSGDRYRVMDRHPEAQARERAFLTDPAAYLGTRGMDALHAVRDVIGLDFFGIDFTPDGEGDLIVFEANAAMRHNFDHVGAFPYTRPQLERISRAFSEMLSRRYRTPGRPPP